MRWLNNEAYVNLIKTQFVISETTDLTNCAICESCRHILCKGKMREGWPALVSNDYIRKRKHKAKPNHVKRINVQVKIGPKPGPRPDKKILSLQYARGKNKELFNFRPELKKLFKHIREWCEENQYIGSEVGFYLTYQELLLENQRKRANALLEFYNGHSGALSARRSFASKLILGQSQRIHKKQRLFLKQQLKRHIFASEEEEAKVFDSLKPRSISFKLYRREQPQDLLKTYEAPVRPEPTVGDTKKTKEFQNQLKAYRKKLEPPDWQHKFPTHPEGPSPNALVS